MGLIGLIYIMTYSFSTPLLNDIRALNAAGQRAIHRTIYKHLVENGTCVCEELLVRYAEDYNLLFPFDEDKGYMLLRRATNSLDSLIDEVDYYHPIEFLKIVEVLGPIIKEWKK